MATTNTHRVWTGVIWEESMDPNMINNFEEEGIRAFIIRHDKDKYNDGTLKKVHYHVTSVFQGKKSYDQISDLYKRCAGNGVNTVQYREDICGAARYLCHLDNPNKFQYDVHEVICLNGADYLEAVTSTNDLNKYDQQIKLFVGEYGIYYFNVLSDYATFVVPDWHKCVDGRAVFWVKYLNSMKESYNSPTGTKQDEIIKLINQIKYEVKNET